MFRGAHRLMLMTMLIFTMPAAVASADEYPGKQKSTTCQACHGPSGLSANDHCPNLAHQKKDYLIEQLKRFRDGGRLDPLMSPMAKMLSDQDIADLAAYYAAGAP
jgi:cytochrome c553